MIHLWHKGCCFCVRTGLQTKYFGVYCPASELLRKEVSGKYLSTNVLFFDSYWNKNKVRSAVRAILITFSRPTFPKGPKQTHVKKLKITRITQSLYRADSSGWIATVSNLQFKDFSSGDFFSLKQRFEMPFQSFPKPLNRAQNPWKSTIQLSSGTSLVSMQGW